MSVVDTLRARFRPEWKTRTDLAGLDTMLEDALSFIAAPKLKKAALEKPGTLNGRGVAEALRRDLGKHVVPELRRILRVVGERREAMKHERATLAKPKIDATDLAAAMLRQEMRTYLRGLDLSERMTALTDKPDPAMLAAALEAPAALSGLNAETRAHVAQTYVQATHAQTLKAMDDREEALDVVGAAAEIASMEIRSSVGLEPQAFDSWFETADGTEAQRAA
jgi:hypothetical protein